MRSMTGYGRGKAEAAGSLIAVEISSVNRKQSEIALALPRPLVELEPRVREEINARISRGRLTVAITFHAGHSHAARTLIDMEAAKAYYAQLQQLNRLLKLKEPVTLDLVLRGPGVFTESDREETDPETIWPALKKALNLALDHLLTMRRREGAVLAKDLRKRIKFLRSTAVVIAKQAPQVLERHRVTLYESARKAQLEITPNDERLLKEIVFFADRSDITEELTRFGSHLEQLDALFDKEDAVGRTLDFILQELNREVNTIGSKANDLLISQSVVALKTELEKIREQVQNIE